MKDDLKEPVPVTFDGLRNAWLDLGEAEGDFLDAKCVLRQAEEAFNQRKAAVKESDPDVWTQFLVWRKEYEG